MTKKQPHFWTEREVAECYGFSVKTLQKWRHTGEGPGYLKIGHNVRYDPEELTAYIESCRRNSVVEATK